MNMGIEMETMDKHSPTKYADAATTQTEDHQIASFDCEDSSNLDDLSFRVTMDGQQNLVRSLLAAQVDARGTTSENTELICINQGRSDKNSSNDIPEYHSLQTKKDATATIMQPNMNTMEDSSRLPLRDLTGDRKLVGESSQNFIKTLHGAAQKRKKAMTRSRDSLIAKELEQKLSIAAFTKATKSLLTPTSDSSRSDSVMGSTRIKPTNQKSTSDDGQNTFKARPLPATTGIGGVGGLIGVPKIDRRPGTTPMSPLLGNRRRAKPAIKSLEEPSNWKESKKGTVGKSSERSSYQGTRTGSTKAGTNDPTSQGARRKRAMSFSKPELCSRSKAGTKSLEVEIEHDAQESVLAKDTQMIAGSPVLHGLRLIETPAPKRPQRTKETETALSPIIDRIKPFEPQSTVRAKSRAEFDRLAKVLQCNKVAARAKQRRESICQIQHELDTIRPLL